MALRWADPRQPLHLAPRESHRLSWLPWLRFSWLPLHLHLQQTRLVHLRHGLETAALMLMMLSRTHTPLAAGLDAAAGLAAPPELTFSSLLLCCDAAAAPESSRDDASDGTSLSACWLSESCGQSITCCWKVAQDRRGQAQLRVACNQPEHQLIALTCEAASLSASLSASESLATIALQRITYAHFKLAGHAAEEVTAKQSMQLQCSSHSCQCALVVDRLDGGLPPSAPPAAHNVAHVDALQVLFLLQRALHSLKHE